MAKRAISAPKTREMPLQDLPEPAANPQDGIFYSFSLPLPPTYKRHQAIAFGTWGQHEDGILPVFVMAYWESGQELVGTSLRFPDCRIAHRDVEDVDGPHRRTMAQIEREFGPLPPPTLEDHEF